MYAQNSPSGMSGNASAVATASGLATAILLTPLVFERTRGWLFSYFIKTVGREYAQGLTWIAGAIEGYAIYAVVTFIVTLLLTWLLMAFASRI